jgi:hypothetical protein
MVANNVYCVTRLVFFRKKHTYLLTMLEKPELALFLHVSLRRNKYTSSLFLVIFVVMELHFYHSDVTVVLRLNVVHFVILFS